MLHEIRWTSQKIRKRIELIEPYVYRRRRQISPYRCHIIDDNRPHPPAVKEIEALKTDTILPGEYWVGPRTNFVLLSSFKVPPSWGDGSSVALYLPIGAAGDFSHPESMVYIDEEPYAACDRHHQEVLLSPMHCDGESHTLLLHGWTGGVSSDDTDRLKMDPGWVVQIDLQLREFVALTRVALGIADHLHDHDPVRHNLLNGLDRAFKVLDTREPLNDRLYSSVLPALNVLKDELARSGGALQVEIVAIGHAHIDVAWLWTLSETRRKAGKTFLNMLRMMEENPAFRFTQSQPQLYEFVRQDYPEIFQEIRDRIESEQWEPIGGMWVEADCNLSGGESLVRQLLLGRKYFENQFGTGSDSPILWLPDVFGYAANLPQLIKKSGLEYFFTIKLGWNQYNRLPYDTFWWEGIDGTRVLTHFSPTKQPDSAMVSTYNADASPGQILSTWTNFQGKDLGKPGIPPPLMMSYGYGDGGGGPTREMLENIEILHSFPGAPRVRFGTALEFFRELEERIGDRLPTWSGELYLEYHRGTYTTQGHNKRANRKNEFRLHDAEFLASFAALTIDDYVYPHDELLSAWRILCLNQFHDILPGSSIGEVYAESRRQYTELASTVNRIQDLALEVIAGSSADRPMALMINPTPFEQNSPVFVEVMDGKSTGLSFPNGELVAHQKVDQGWLLDAGMLPAYSVTPLIKAAGESTSDASETRSLRATNNFLENTHLRVELNDQGDIARIYDKNGAREVVPKGEIANQLQLFEDRPRIPDAWDIDIFYDDVMWRSDPASSIKVIESGPLRATLEVRRRLFSSDFVQHISLFHNSPLLVFSTVVDWREKQTLLKVAFPVVVLSPQATYEIQWGNVQRPTHRNTSWDWARFETCAHKWVDLSEGGYGVSLINDCKYGHDIQGNVIRLTLLRGPSDPDPQADLGRHRFSYALLPHEGSWDISTIAAAYAFNDPPFSFICGNQERAGESGALPIPEGSFIRSASKNVVVETIKHAEDGRGVIVRLYESMRIRGATEIVTSFPLAGVWLCDLLENNIEPLDTGEDRFWVNLDPFEIVTLRLMQIK